VTEKQSQNGNKNNVQSGNEAPIPGGGINHARLLKRCPGKYQQPGNDPAPGQDFSLIMKKLRTDVKLPVFPDYSDLRKDPAAKQLLSEGMEDQDGDEYRQTTNGQKVLPPPCVRDDQ
jgi:hypothetical protein